MRMRSIVLGGTFLAVLCSSSGLMAQQKPDDKKGEEYSLPEALQPLNAWVGLFSGSFGTLQGVQWGIATIASIANGTFSLTGSDNTEQLLQAIQLVDGHVLELTDNLKDDAIGTDFEIIYQNEADKLSSLETVIENLFPSPNLPPNQIMSPDDMHARLEDVANYLVKPTAYQRGYVAGADDSAISGPESAIPNTSLTSFGGVSWKSIISDRSTPGSSGSAIGQVYDWRVGVPFLIQAATLELTAMSKLDPAFASDGAYDDITGNLLHALQSNLTMMIDGVRCGTSHVGGYQRTEVGCADVYTGANQTYTLQDPAWSRVAGWGSLPVNVFMTSCYLNQSISPDLPMGGAPCTCLDRKNLESPADWDNLPSGWQNPYFAKLSADNLGGGRYMPGYVPGESASCDARFDTYALQPAAAAARTRVLAQMPLASMRSLIGLLTQMRNPRPNQTPWTSCVNAYNFNGTRFTLGDTGCKGTSDIALLPTFGGWSSIPVAFPWPGSNAISDTNYPASYWPQRNGNWQHFVQEWAPQAQALAGDFGGDGRSDIALTGVPGWWSIPVAHALGDGTYAVTNNMLAPHSNNCDFAVSGGPTCTHLGLDYRGRSIDFTAAAASPCVQAVSGDFDNDGFTDIALVGGPGWVSIPVAFSDGGGSFSNITNYDVPLSVGNFGGAQNAAFTALAAQSGSKAIAGDFNGDGNSDIALVNGAWQTVPVAFSNGDGTFRAVNTSTNSYVATNNGDGTFSWGGDFNFETFVSWAPFSAWGGSPSLEYSKVIGGDFDGDGYYDIAALAGSTSGSIAIAFSNGEGSFTTISNVPLDPSVDMSVLAQSPMVGGDFDGDGRFDIAYSSFYTANLHELLSGGMVGSMTLFDPVIDMDFNDWWNTSPRVRAIGAF